MNTIPQTAQASEHRSDGGVDELLLTRETNADLSEHADDKRFRDFFVEMARPAEPVYFDISGCDDDHPEPVPIPTDLWAVNTGSAWELIEADDEFGWPLIRMAAVVAMNYFYMHIRPDYVAPLLTWLEADHKDLWRMVADGLTTIEVARAEAVRRVRGRPWSEYCWHGGSPGGNGCYVNAKGEHFDTACPGQARHVEHVERVGAEQAAYDFGPIIARRTRIDWSAS